MKFGDVVWWSNPHNMKQVGALEARFCCDVPMWPSFEAPECVIYVLSLGKRIVVSKSRVSESSPICREYLIVGGHTYTCERPAAHVHTHHIARLELAGHKIKLDWY